MKRILCGLLTFCILLTCAVSTAAGTMLTTTHLPDGSLTFSIDGPSLTISGAILCDGLEKIRLGVGAEERYLTAGSGKKITETFSLSGTEPIPVTVYTKKTGEELYWSYIWQTITIEATETGYRFTDTPVYDHNQVMMRDIWLNPADHLSDTIDPAVAEKSAEIVGSETDPYKKLFAIHTWVAENLYYDNDYAAGRTETTPTTAAEVLAAGYTVCQGYANLVKAFCQAQGIPCVIVSTYGAGTGTDGFISAEDHTAGAAANHAHAAAWVNGRWIHMDTTWDSMGRYENGTKYRGVSSGYLYFDTTLEYLSRNHKILGFPEVSVLTPAENIPSEWAVPEVRAALEAEIVPCSLQKNYRNPITRAGFCELLMAMLQRRLGYETLDELIAGKGLTVDETVFTDTAELSVRREIASASALGIVNGRGGGIFDPSSGITRQEAAVMLMRAAQVLEIEMGETPRSFADMADADTWAAMGILYTSSLQTEEGQAVMGGVSDTEFSPKTSYTAEQAILTMIRLFTVGE